MMQQHVTRTIFAQKLQEIINRYNAGNSSNEDYFNDLMALVQQMKEEEQRASREELMEQELEIFNSLKKENLTQDEEQKVKLGAKDALHSLQGEKSTVFINTWYKGTQTKLQEQLTIQQILNKTLPDSYN